MLAIPHTSSWEPIVKFSGFFQASRKQYCSTILISYSAGTSRERQWQWSLKNQFLNIDPHTTGYKAIFFAMGRSLSLGESTSRKAAFGRLTQVSEQWTSRSLGESLTGSMLQKILRNVDSKGHLMVICMVMCIVWLLAWRELKLLSGL